MAKTWTFSVVDSTNHKFEISAGHKRLSGSGDNSSGASKITGGLVTSNPDGTPRVLVSFADGRTAEYRPAHTAGRLEFVRWV